MSAVPRMVGTLRIVTWVGGLLAAAAAFPVDRVAAQADAEPVTLRYLAYVAGSRVGEATVQVAVDGGRYQVSGSAHSDGVLQGFSDWRNRFSAEGVLAGTERRGESFDYTERDRDKVRHVLVRDGTLQVTKNGKRRPQRVAPPGPDLISALFVGPHCEGDQRLHTGRHSYRLVWLGGDSETCRYRVVDDDDDTFEIDLRLGRLGSLVVLDEVRVHGWLSGRIERVGRGIAG